MNLNKLIEDYNIKQIHISKGLTHNKDTILKNIKYCEYGDINETTLFWGMYNYNDVKKFELHKGPKLIFWGGSDSDPLKLKKINDRFLSCKLHICLHNYYVYDNLISYFDNVQSIVIDKPTNLVPTNIVSSDLVSIILPTLNRFNGFKNVVNQMLNQTYSNIELVIIDDGSELDVLKEKEIFIHSKNDNRIKFFKNEVNKKLPYSINRGIQNSSGNFITWISDDNDYFDIFIETLVCKNSDFTYSDFEIHFEDLNKTKVIKKNFTDLNNLISKYRGLASFMYSRKLINDIGLYDENLFKVEDYEYLLRIFNKCNSIKYIPITTMSYKRHSESLYSNNEEFIRKISDDINKIYEIINDKKSNNVFLYYSKTAWNLLFQRPHQIMRFMDKSLFKVFITSDDIVKFEEDNNLLIINFRYKDIIFNNFKDIIIYYTDSRLYNEIFNYQCKKIYDLIDAPIGEFEVWKTNLNNCVKNSDHVIYSHPDLVNFLNDIDNTKKYTYISNACDYKHFSSAKDRIGERPNDFPQTDKPILGYYGAFSEWLDYDIIRKYADEGQYHIVMIGGIQGNAKYNIRLEHENITWLNHKAYDELPYYLSWFDKCFLPFKDCELTKYVNPCKLWEYMASEKEIIKHNVNMGVDKIVTYDDVYKKLYLLLNPYKLEFIILASVPYDDIGGGQRSAQITKSLIDRNIYTTYIYKYKKFDFKLNKHIDSNFKNNFVNHIHIKDIKDYNSLLNKNKYYLILNEIPDNDFLDILIFIKNNIQNHTIIYDIIDNWHNPELGWFYNESIENKILELSDLVTYVTKYFKLNYSDKIINKKQLYLPNASNPFEFNLYYKSWQHGIITKLKEKYKKIILYYGSLYGSWFDWDLIKYSANKNQDFAFVLIGDYNKKISNIIDGYENIILTGLVEINHLKYFSKHADICLIPFKDENVCNYVSPIKIFEYLFINKSVVTTSCMIDVLDYPNTYFSNNKEEFNDHIVNINSNDIITLESEYFIMNNSWCKRVDDLLNIIDYRLPVKFSVIVLCYNNKNIISKNIDSFLKVNNIVNIELIIVDNNSTDGSYDFIANKYNKKVKLLSNKKNGCSSGRNIGIDNISKDSDYICFFDSDQWITSSSCFFEVHDIYKINNDNIGAIGWAAGFFDNDKLGGRIADYLQNRGMDEDEYKNKGYRTDFTYLGSGGLFLKKEIVDKYKLKFDENYDPTCFEDTDFTFQVKSKGLKLAYRNFKSIMHKPHQTTKSSDTNGSYQKLFNKNSNYFKKKWNL